MSTEKKEWAVIGYWIMFNPNTHQGTVALNLDNDAQSDLKFENLPAPEVAALAAVLNSGHAVYHRDGYIYTKN